MKRTADRGQGTAGQPVDPKVLAQTIKARMKRTADSGQRAAATPSTVALISCTKSKDPAARTARELYWPSALFRGAVTSVERRGIPWMVLSARHGLLAPEDPVRIYDETLIGASRERRRAWAEQVVADLDARRLLDGQVRFEIHAGEAYLRPLVDLLETRGTLVDLPLLGMTLGERLSYYKGS